MIADVIDARQREILQAIWAAGPISRWELHEQTKLSPNRVGTVVDGMIRDGILREGSPSTPRAGRPRVPLEIDPSTRHIIGLAIAPGGFTLCRMGLGGTLIERIATPALTNPSRLIPTAAAALAKAMNAGTLSVGVTVTGFLDPARRVLLLSSALPDRKSASLQPIDDAAGDRPVVIGNDMHALAARWLLLRRAEPQQDVLLVWFTDGRLGSAILINGRPNRGCFTGGNELGHTRYVVDTERCFCGQIGCLERIVSTDFLSRQDQLRKVKPSADSLADRAASFAVGADPSLQTLLDYLCGGLANAVNFVRPHRLVLVTPLARHTAFATSLAAGIRERILPEMADAVHLDFWDQPATESAENAAWLANAELMWTGWDAARTS